MREIKTASYLKLSQEVFTPAMEDEYADQQQSIGRRVRDIGLGGKRRPRRGLSKRELQDGSGQVDGNMDTKQWKDWVKQNLSGQEDQRLEESRRLLEKLREPAFANSEEMIKE